MMRRSKLPIKVAVDFLVACLHPFGTVQIWLHPNLFSVVAAH